MKKKTKSLYYIFKEETSAVFSDSNFDAMFYVDGSRHPNILKEYLRGKVSLETMVICDIILEYSKEWDKKLNDPVWETVSRKIKKYSPFLNIQTQTYKKILKEVILHGSR